MGSPRKWGRSPRSWLLNATKNGCVEDHDGAGDVGHAAAHRDEQFAAREPIEIGPDQQRRFQHAQKNIGRRAESDGAADAHGFLQHPGKGPDHERQDFPVEKERGEGADDQDQRQRLEGKNERRSRIGLRKGKLPASQIAEGEGGARGCGFFEDGDSPVQQLKEIAEERNFEQGQRQDELNHKTRDDDGVTDGTPVLADQPGEARQKKDSGNALQVHVPDLPVQVCGAVAQ